MKKFLTVAMALIIVCGVSFADTKDQKEIRKERQEITKLAKKELNTKVGKVVKKEAKRLKKEGWQVKPGALPLDKQLERAYLMQYEYDEDLFPKYIMGEASSVGESYDAAKTAALSLAITNLAGQIQTEVTALIENTVMECFRINSKKNNEVLVRIAYNSEMAKQAAKKAIRQDLEEKGKKLHGQLDQVLGF